MMTDETDDKLTIHIHATPERLEGMSNRTLRLLQKSPEAMYDYVAHFMVDENGDYLDYEEAIDILDDLTLADMKEAGAAVEQAIREAAAPKSSGRKSTNRHATK
jgi:uncharacterized protein YutE (UPF0331/DUF86 family)